MLASGAKARRSPCRLLHFKSCALTSPQTENAEALLALAENVLLTDPEYVARIKRHYELFRSKIRALVNQARILQRKSLKSAILGRNQLSTYRMTKGPDS